MKPSLALSRDVNVRHGSDSRLLSHERATVCDAQGSPSLAAFSGSTVCRGGGCALVRKELQSLLADDNIELTLDRQSTRPTLAPINAWR